MKISLPERLAGTRDALFVLEIEFPVATEGRTVEIATEGSIEALDLRGTGPGGTYEVPVGLEQLHVPMRVTQDTEGEAKVKVTCVAGPESGSSEERTMLLEKGAIPAASGSGGKLAIAAILVALLGGAAFFLGPKLFGADKVPSVAGKSEREAVALLQKAEYVTEIVQQDVSDRAKHGRVIRTIPAAGDALAKGERVQVVVGNMQDDMVKVDSVVGQTLDAAEAALSAAGFQPVTQYVDAQPEDEPGRVLRQSPDGGAFLERGREVELFVARAADVPTPDVPTPDVPTPDVPTPDVPTPDVPTPDVPTPDVPTPDVPTPDVPTPDVPVPDKPPAFGLIRLPSLVDRTLADAKVMLEGYGLLAITEFEGVDDAAQADKVLRQYPAGGADVSRGSQVFLTVGRYSAPPPDVPTPDVPTPDVPTPDVPVPDVPTPDVPTPDVPMPDVPTPDVPTPDVPDVPTPDVPTPDVPTPDVPTPDVPTPDVPTPDVPTPDVPQPDVPTPDVPEPDRPVRPGAALRVPDLIGLTRERATGLVRAAGFRYRLDLETTADVPDGQILSQRPAPDAELVEGGTIVLVVARAPAVAGVVVPDVVGKTREEAARLLRAEGFLVSTTLSGGPAERIGRVAAQSPDAGSRAKSRSWVELVVVSGVGPMRQPSGAKPPALPTPSDDAPSVPDASAGLERAPAVGDGPTTMPPPTPSGAQPVPPVQLPPADAEPANVVPDVARTGIKEAVRRVLEAGLIPIVEIDRSGDGATGQVLRQSPAGGTSARAGALVRLGVRVAPTTQERYVSLPVALGGLLVKEREALRAAGMQVEVIEVTAPGHPYAGTGRVAAQYPVSSVPRSLARTVTIWIVR